MKTNLKYLRLLTVFAMMAFVAIGCSDDDDNPMTPDTMSGEAMLRVVHASPDAPPVDVYAEGVAEALITNLAYGETSAYLDLDAGTYNVQLRAAGADAASAPAFETGPLAIADMAKITAVAAGLLSSTDDDDKFRVIPLVENFEAPGAGMTAVRIVHASADAPSVSLDVGDDADPEINGFERFADTGAAGVALPANTELQIAVWAGNPLSRVTAFTTPALPADADIFVIATGLLGSLPRENDGFNLLAVGPNGTIGFIPQNPVVFALHGSPDAPPVDIYAGDAELVNNLSFAEISAAVQVPPGSYELSFRANGSMDEAAKASTPELMAGERYLAIASGYLNSMGEMAFTLLPFADGFDLDTMSPLVRVIHASADAPPVDVGTVSGGIVTAVGDFTDLSYKQGSLTSGTQLPVGTLPIGIAATGTTAPVASFSVGTADGLRGYAVAAGSFTGSGEAFRLIVVDTAVFPWTAAQIMPNP
jgi:uncharacterized protein DUF4397